MRLVAVVIAVAMLAIIQPGAAIGSAYQVVPDPSECLVEPRDAAWVAALFAMPATPAATPERLDASPVAVPDLPRGEVAPQEILFAMNATLTEIVACLNAGDPLRALALLSDGIAPADVIVLGLFDPAVVAAGRPTPVAVEDRMTVPSIIDPRVLEDGRAGAVVTIGTETQQAFFVIFVEQDGRWLIDEAFEIDGGGAGGP